MASKPPPPLVWADGRLIDFSVLKKDISGPRMMSVRSIFSGHPSVGLSPERIAELLIEAEQGETRAYLELAEDIEEKDMQYASVLSTRKRAVAQEPMEVIPAGESPEEKDDAKFIEDWLKRDTLEDELVEILDGLGKSYSATEIIWDMTSSLWIPGKLERRDPRWFRFDLIDGETLQLWTEDGPQPLKPFKFIVHKHPVKSGLTIRGGLARPAMWGWMLKNFSVKEWAAYIESYGQPLRVGRYEVGTNEEDIRDLMMAVAQVGQDAAAVFPKSMDIEFIQSAQSSKGEPGGLFKTLADYVDQQISKLVLGQTGTTDAIAGGHAVGKVHDEVRGDIKRSDCKKLAATLNRDLVRPMIMLNMGERRAYPKIRIGAPDPIDVKALADAAKTLVPLGMRVSMPALRDKVGLPAPKTGEEELQVNAPANAPEASPEGVAAPGGAKSGKTPFLPLLKGPQEAKRAASQGGDAAVARDAVEEAVDEALDDWMPLMQPVVDPIDDLVRNATSLEELRDGLAGVVDKMDVTQIADAMARMSFGFRMNPPR